MPESAYNRVLIEARREFLSGGIPARAIREVYVEFAALMIRIERQVAEGAINAARGEALMRSIRAAMDRYAERFTEIIVSSAQGSAEAAAAAHSASLSAASFAAGVSISHSFASVPTRALENLMIRRGLDDFGGLARTYRTLINLKIENVADEVDRIIFRAVAEGKSVNELTTELARVMANGDEVLLRTLSNLGPNGGRTAAAIKAGTQIPKGQLSEAKSLLNSARLFAQTEPLVAYHESAVQGMVESPVVKGTRWQLSGNHPQADACDVLQDSDIYGLGTGVYPVRNTPSRPHPRCRCIVTAVVAEPAEWGDLPKPAKPLRQVGEAQMRKVLGKDASDAYIKSQRAMVNDKLRFAFEAAQEQAVAA